MPKREDLPEIVATVNVVVFGHDGDHGGTTAVVVPRLDITSVAAAVAHYARRFAKDDSAEMWTASLAQAEEALMFCAELHSREVLPMDCDLEDDAGLIVLIDALTTDDADDQPGMVALRTRRAPVQLEAVRLPSSDRLWAAADRWLDTEFWSRFTLVLTTPTRRRWDRGGFAFVLEQLTLSPAAGPRD